MSATVSVRTTAQVDVLTMLDAAVQADRQHCAVGREAHDAVARARQHVPLGDHSSVGDGPDLGPAVGAAGDRQARVLRREGGAVDRRSRPCKSSCAVPDGGVVVLEAGRDALGRAAATADRRGAAGCRARPRAARPARRRAARATADAAGPRRRPRGRRSRCRRPRAAGAAPRRCCPRAAAARAAAARRMRPPVPAGAAGARAGRGAG